MGLVVYCQLSLAANADINSLDEIVISATRTDQRVIDTAASINVTSAEQIHDAQPEESLSEPLERIPGISALNRQNYAQDLLISSRGFGANSTFGARGIKIYVDNIPGTVADGQGQISHIDLASADRIEVLRGPYSVLYGNSAGGVISVFTENGKPGAEVTSYFSSGSFGQLKSGIKFDGDQNGINYVLDDGTLHTDGTRDHSAADRINVNSKLGFKIGQDTSLSFVVNSVSLGAQDPLGLTATQLAADPRSAQNVGSYNTRKNVAQSQGGLVVSQQLSSNDLITISPYSGDRHTTQFLATTNSGVINLNRNFYGMDSNWQHSKEIGNLLLKVVVGIDSNENDDHRLAYTNSTGNQTGNATQDYTMKARNLDVYIQTELRPSNHLTLNAGLRQSETMLSSFSNLQSLISPGSNVYQDKTGMASIQYFFQDEANVYLSYGSGFDTPTLNQVFYSPSYVNGLNANVISSANNAGNINLQAARTQQVEIGLKDKISSATDASIAIFDANTSNDIVIDSSNFGKTAFTNAPKTRRQGFELSAQSLLPYQLQFSLAYTFLIAKVDQAYLESNGTAVNAGSRIPGVPSQSLFSELIWRTSDKSFEVAAEGIARGSMAANDVNGAFSAGYGILNLRTAFKQETGAWTVSEFIRLDNIFDRSYVGSVIVNQASSMYYESAPSRNWFAGLKASYKF